ncbi:MAG: hypothetical protein IPI10_17500 [Bacteroidetes bacterium]|nr:hypothetical protein [Bacteroidota bacterium]
MSHIFDTLNIIEKIKSGDNQPLYDLYNEFRDDFIRWALNTFPCNEEEAKDVFQECIIRFYRNITNNSLQYLTCDIKTYLWAIGKYQLLNLTKIKQRTVTYSTDKLINTTEAAEDSMSNKEEENHNKENGTSTYITIRRKKPKNTGVVLSRRERHENNSRGNRL